MAAEHKPIHVQPDSELALVVRSAVTDGPVLLELDENVYELEIRPAAMHSQPGEESRRDSLFNIIGLSQTGEPTDIARHKDEYLAEAYTPRKR
jgi:hypothetical protein